MVVALSSRFLFLERSELPEGTGPTGAVGDRGPVEALTFEALGLDGASRGAMSGPRSDEMAPDGVRHGLEPCGAFGGNPLTEGSSLGGAKFHCWEVRCHKPQNGQG